MKSFLKKIVAKILAWEARRILKKHKPKIIAVTGSVGKTSTKDAIYLALSKSEYTRKSEKSYNSEIGVPLTILGLPNAWDSVVGWIENIGEGFILPWRREEYPKWLVLEIGVDRPGDIQRFSWLRPNIVVFTQLPKVPVHVEYFESPEALANEKRLLKEYLTEEGTLIVNGDDVRLGGEEVKEGQHKLTYGVVGQATVHGSDYRVEYENGLPVGISFSATFQDSAERIQLKGVLGMHHMYPVLCALTVLVTEGKSITGISEVFGEKTMAPGRMRLLEGIHGSVIVDDSYNSSPVAVRAGIETLAHIEVPGKKIAVLGDMLELGDYSVEAHRKVGELVSGNVDVCITVGVRMLGAAEAVMQANGRCKRVESFKTAKEAIGTVQMLLEEGDVVFVKGSQGIRLERLVEQILRDPNEAVQVLPRQDPHWKQIP